MNCLRLLLSRLLRRPRGVIRFGCLLRGLAMTAGMLTMMSCAYVQGARVRPEGEAMHHPVPFWLGFALNPINSILWVANRIPLPYLEMNALPQDDDSTVKGFRYYLPKPFLLVHQDASGQIKTEVLLLPDPREQYAVAAWNSLGVQSFGMTIGDGASNEPNNHLLTKTGFNVANAAVVQELVRSVGTVGSAAIEKIGEGAAEARTKLPGLRLELEAVKAEEANAQASMIKASSELETIKKNTDCVNKDTCKDIADFNKAEDKLSSARKTHQEAQKKKKMLEHSIRELERVANPFDKPMRGSKGTEVGNKLQGPALFEIHMENGGVILRPVKWDTQWAAQAFQPSGATRLEIEIK